jgi:hypothetical protein
VRTRLFGARGVVGVVGVGVGVSHDDAVRTRRRRPRQRHQTRKGWPDMKDNNKHFISDFYLAELIFPHSLVGRVIKSIKDSLRV